MPKLGPCWSILSNAKNGLFFSIFFSPSVQPRRPSIYQKASKPSVNADPDLVQWTRGPKIPRPDPRRWHVIEQTNEGYIPLATIFKKIKGANFFIPRRKRERRKPLRTSLILSRGESGYMVLKDKKPYYFSSTKDIAQMLVGLIEPPSQNHLVAITVELIQREKAGTKEDKHGKV